MEDIFEIKDTEIDVPEIMERIRSNIEKRKKEGLYTEEELAEAEGLKLGEEPKRQDFVEHYLRAAGVLCNIDVERYKFGIPPFLNRPLLGHMVIASKEAIRRILRFHTRAIFKQQVDFNRHMVQLMNGLFDRIEELENELSDLRSQLRKK